MADEMPAADSAEELLKAPSADLTQQEVDTIIRSRWLAGVRAVDIRKELGIRHVGVLGARVFMLGLPPRNHRGGLMWSERRTPVAPTTLPALPESVGRPALGPVRSLKC
jgi:hypothetical protein